MKTTEAKVQEMKVNELVEMLTNWSNGTAPLSVITVTTPKINKAGKEKFGEVMKVANAGGLLGYDYENSVNNQREKEQKLRDFLSEPLWNGKGRRVSPAMSEHIDKGTKYMTYKHQQTNSVNYIDSQGNVIDINDLKEFFYKSKNRKQGTNKVINHREVKINNIRYIKMNGIKYKIVH
jgi:hypothetical protein